MRKNPISHILKLNHKTKGGGFKEAWRMNVAERQKESYIENTNASEEHGATWYVGYDQRNLPGKMAEIDF